jgi:hypothetical protein
MDSKRKSSTCNGSLKKIVKQKQCTQLCILEASMLMISSLVA